MELRPLVPTDTEAWSQLIALVFNRTPAEAGSVWQWLNAHQDLLAWGAWDGNTLAAQYSCLLRTLYLPATQSTHLVGISTNMAVHPAYRGRGLVKQVAEPVYAALRDRGALAGVGFSNADGVKVDQRSQSYGYKVVGALSSHLIWLRQSAAADRAMPMLISELGAGQLAGRTPSGMDCRPTGPEVKICFHNSLDNLQHRFGAHPFRHYRFWVFRSSDGAAQGVVVDRPTALFHLTGSSLLAAYGRDITQVLQGWTLAIREQGAHFVRVLATPYSASLRALNKVGLSFKLRPRHPHYLTVKPLQADCPVNLFDLAQWDCLGGEVL